MQILITGGAGFLGRHLARRYSSHGASVTVLDDLSSPNSSFDVPELASPDIRCVEGSIFDVGLIGRLVCDHLVIIHLASVVGVGQTIDTPIETARNLTGTLNLVDRLTPEHTILFGSTADVYGMHSQIYDRPMCEEDDVLFEHAHVNRWVYPKIKSVEENVVAASAARSSTVRIFNCIGPGMDYPHAKRVVPQFLQAIDQRRPLRLSGSGSQVRCFSYFTDTLDGMEKALSYAMHQAPGPAGVFNIGSDMPISMQALAHMMNRIAVELELLREPLPIIHAPEELYSQPFYDEWDRVPDLKRARAVLGFSPTVDLESALRLTLAAHRDSRALQVPAAPPRF